MASTVEFGVFLNGPATYDRLTAAQNAARGMGVTVASNGERFAGQGHASDPIKVTVTLPRGTDADQVTAAQVRQGRDAFDAILREGERLTDYALVKADGDLVAVASLLTGDVQVLLDEDGEDFANEQAIAPAPAAPRRWSPFRR